MTPRIHHELEVPVVGVAAVFLFWLWAVVATGTAQDAPVETQLGGGEPSREVMREINDPHTGDRWLLMRNARNPEGPGRMVLTGNMSQSSARELEKGLRPTSMSQSAPSFLTVIRAGDHVTIEENLPRVRARFDAIALGNAAMGASLNVRLAIGGKVVRATAIGHGRAAFSLQKESWR